MIKVSHGCCGAEENVYVGASIRNRKAAFVRYYYLLKGKAEVEVALLCMAYNMWRAINMVGVRQLVAALGRENRSCPF